ncbi:MAG: VCBS repeat-containing protein, partial [Planctomycetes bacterium]|nr:VCBS repeat-containing protein [Planctomycetota bacterium]
GEWFIDLNGNGTWDKDDLWAKLGYRDDMPVTGDWDGDGKTDIGIFGPAWPGDPRAVKAEPGLPEATNDAMGKKKNVPPEPDEAAIGVRRLQRSSRGVQREDLIDHVFHYGIGGDKPVAGDWNGDGVATIGVFRDGEWVMDTDGDGKTTGRDQSAQFGQAGDLPVVGDFNGDGLDELGVFRDGAWYLDTNGNRRIDPQDRVIYLGARGDRPVVGDWDGDGADEVGTYQPGVSAESETKTSVEVLPPLTGE